MLKLKDIEVEVVMNYKMMNIINNNVSGITLCKECHYKLHHNKKD
jgi:hypothetical protein